MSQITIKLNLRQLQHAITTTAKGNKCIIIPIEANKLFEGEKGLYLDLIAFELTNKKPDSKDTHIIKQSIAKDVYKTMTEDQKNQMPILGNLIVWSGNYEPDPRGETIEDIENEIKGDLPF